jgi:chitinase
VHGFDKVNRDFYSLANNMANAFQGWMSFPAILKEYDNDKRAFASKYAQDLMTACYNMILNQLSNVNLSNAAEHVSQLITTCKELG